MMPVGDKIIRITRVFDETENTDVSSSEIAISDRLTLQPLLKQY